MKKYFLLLIFLVCIIPLSVSISFSLPVGETGIVTDIDIIVTGSGCGGCIVSRYKITLDTGLVFDLEEYYFTDRRINTPYPKIGDKIEIIQFDTGCGNYYGTVETIRIID